jgi:hypothetical protein
MKIVINFVWDTAIIAGYTNARLQIAETILKNAKHTDASSKDAVQMCERNLKRECTVTRIFANMGKELA